MLHIICQVVVMLRLTIIERTVSFRRAAILQVDIPYIKPVRHISNLSAIYQTCPPYIKPVRPYLTPRGAEVCGIWHINRASVLHMTYHASACDVMAHRLWRKLPSFRSSLVTAILEVDMPYM